MSATSAGRPGNVPNTICDTTTETDMPNIELLKKTLDFIKTNPDEWEQGYWITPADERKNPACGTAYCFAGHAVLLAGYDITNQAVKVNDLPNEVRARIPSRDIERLWSDGTTLVAEIPAVAAALLDIPDFWSATEQHLFDGHNRLEDLERIVAELCGETVGAGAQ